MKTLSRSITVAAGLVVSATALALTHGFDIEIQNLLSVPATIEISQYHAEGFDGTRPKNFTENLWLSTEVFSLPPLSSRTVYYNDATGGFWLLWKRKEPTNVPQTSGVLELAERKHIIQIK